MNSSILWRTSILNELGVGYRMIDEDPESRQTAEEGV